jgi:ATP phosphoribosyltransferase regulatory subunit
MSEAARETLHSYLSVRGSLASAATTIRQLASDRGIELDAALTRFEARARAIEGRGIRLEDVRFAAASARNMDYYTGFVFDVRSHDAPPGRFVIAGGRYDRLLEQLGAGGPSPAVGCSFWLDRLAGGRT